MKKIQNVIIMGAAGRDFHNFNIFFRNNPAYRVVAFTAEQIPGIAERRYPKKLAGKRYPKGIPIYPEERLPELVKKYKVDLVNLAYSDLPYSEVMQKASLVNACGADFILLGPKNTMLKSKKPVIAVTAVRTGCGKSQTTRYICGLLKVAGKRVVVVRHPMAYGILGKEVVERYENWGDLEKYATTIEEREEYEPLISLGVIVYAGVDYEKVLRKAEKEADIIIWDGGNNDFPFFKPDFQITLADPLRAGHEKEYYPGGINVRLADVIIINKEKSAKKEDIELVEKNVKELNPKAKIIHAASEIVAKEIKRIEGKRVIVVEDGPTLTHGGMKFGAGTIAAKKAKARVVSPRRYAVGSIKEIYKKYKLGKVLPAMGYSKKQIKELKETINKTPCDFVISGTPIDLRKILKIRKPIIKITYKLREMSEPGLKELLKDFYS